MALEAGGTNEGADGFGGASLAADNFAEVFGVHVQLKQGYLSAGNSVYAHAFRMIDESSGNGFHQFLHRASWKINEQLGAGAKPGVYKSQAIFCCLMKLRTVSLGRAPTPSQYLMRSESSLISAGFLSGS
jgi:hypothetical protein